MLAPVQLVEAPTSHWTYNSWEGQPASVIAAASLEIPSEFIRRRLLVRADLNITMFPPPAGAILILDIVFELAGQSVFQLPYRISFTGGASDVQLFIGRGANFADSASKANSVWFGDNSGVIPTAMIALNSHPYHVNLAADRIRVDVREEGGGGLLWDLFLGCHSESLIL